MKNLLLLRSAFSALALLTGIHTAGAQPVLGIAPAGNQSVFYWTATPTNYLLQSTTDLASTNWVYAYDAVPVSAATVPNTFPERFFRLSLTDPPTGMVLIPAGSFTMGNSVGDPYITFADPTNVYVSAFYMDTNLVSYSQWQTVYSYATSQGYAFVHAGSGKAANHPVQTVDWYDSVKWCNARSQLENLTPVYYTDAEFTQVLTTAHTPTTVYANWVAKGYRLPTEAECEKAARGGLNGRRFPWGNLISGNQANYTGQTNLFDYDLGPNGRNAIGSAGGTSPATSPVGSFDVNGYGLYDMAGNVYEWCWDWYGIPYGQPTPINPTGPATGSFRTGRGGSWSENAVNSQCALRYYNFTDWAESHNGFRCVRGL